MRASQCARTAQLDVSRTRSGISLGGEAGRTLRSISARAVSTTKSMQNLILPFDGRIEAAKPYQDIGACLDEWFPEPLPGDAFYELYLPLGAPRPGRDRRGERRLRVLRDWFSGVVAVLQDRAPGRRRWSPRVYERDYVAGRSDGWD
ncbi:MAG: hypothetical protein OXK76_07500 [Gammaproteobacteria bacterium]|nr:hypothetical protein [Gammaproteobacteria bacterium]